MSLSSSTSPFICSFSHAFLFPINEFNLLFVGKRPLHCAWKVWFSGNWLVNNEIKFLCHKSVRTNNTNTNTKLRHRYAPRIPQECVPLSPSILISYLYMQQWLSNSICIHLFGMIFRHFNQLRRLLSAFLLHMHTFILYKNLFKTAISMLKHFL